MSPRHDGVQERPTARDDLFAAAAGLLATGHRLTLVAAHDDGAEAGFRLVYAFAHAGTGERTELVVPVPRSDPSVPSLAALSFPAGRFERAVRDQFGIEPLGHPRPRRLVHHAHWPEDWYPMRRDADPVARFASDESHFDFVPVQGAGVYEIPVGPVHAALIEPGHFRFSVVGETIVRMKARLWFVHRGLEKLAEGRTPARGLELAERVSGDTAVGHGLTYAMAVEAALGLDVTEQDLLVRALLLELERVYNHVADLGAMVSDVGFGIVNVHAQRLREGLLRHNARMTGHRLLRGGVGLGGARLAATPDLDLLRRVRDEAAELVAIALGSAVVLDRFTGTAVLAGEAARAMGTLGYVARASGMDVDARRDHPFVDLGPTLEVCTEPAGDVLARFTVRARELVVSVALIEDLVHRLGGHLGTGTGCAPADEPGPGGPGAMSEPDDVRPGPEPGRWTPAAAGSALVEAWRGTACHRVEVDAAGRIGRWAVVDPSFFTWPALPVCLADTIVPDFPLANKSFNQSYSGNDL